MDFSLARSAMIETQVRPNDVTDRRVLAALGASPKEMFVPAELKSVAYADCVLQAAPGRHLWSARDFGRLLQAAEIEPDDRVLDIASGVGYSVDVLSRLAVRVVALESDESRASLVRNNLLAAGASAEVVVGDLSAGWPASGPYDVIWVNGAVESAPHAWLDQLADGGRLAVVLREGHVARASVYHKSGLTSAGRTHFECGVPLLPGFQRAVSFQF